MPPPASSSHILRISPKELNFPPPFNRVITSILNIHNTSSDFAVAYKVKTTAPQRYCVRPNTGVLPPGETIEVQVLLNHTKDSPPSLDGEDKFQIQSIVLKDSFNDIKEVWSKATTDQVIKQKLKAKFIPAINKTGGLREDTDKDRAATLKRAENERIIQGEEMHTTSTTRSPVVSFHLPPQNITPHNSQPPSPVMETNTGSSVSGGKPLDPSKPIDDPFSDPYNAIPNTIPNNTVPSRNSGVFTPINANTTAVATPTATQVSTGGVPTSAIRPISSPISSAPSIIDVHASLRKALDQVVSLTSEKDSMSTQNRDLSQQLNTLQKQIKELQEKSKNNTNNYESVGLRQRSSNNTSSSTSNTTNSSSAAITKNGNKQLLIIIAVIILMFLLGRWTA